MNALTDDPRNLSWRDKMQLMAENAGGQFRALGIRFVDGTRKYVVLRLPWREELVGNPETGILHGGVITTLIDSACGYALMAHLEQLADIATLDLRIDYLRPAESRREVYARAEVYHMTKSIAFIRAHAYQDDGEPIANAVATFMLGANAPKYQGRKT